MLEALVRCLGSVPMLLLLLGSVLFCFKNRFNDRDDNPRGETPARVPKPRSKTGSGDQRGKNCSNYQLYSLAIAQATLSSLTFFYWNRTWESATPILERIFFSFFVYRGSSHHRTYLASRVATVQLLHNDSMETRYMPQLQQRLQ